MPEQNDITLLHVQRELKPKIEDVIPLCLAGNMRKIALEFIAFLREKKMAPAWSGVHNAWDAKCKGRTICKVSLGSSGWHLNRKCSWNLILMLEHWHEYENSIVNEGLQNIIWDSFKNCHSCLGGKKPCVGGRNVTVFGREFTGACTCGPVRRTWVYDPDEKTIEGVKRLLELEQNARKEI